MFDILKRMENLMIFIEVLGYIAIALMVLQIVLTIGMVTCNSTKSTNKKNNDSFNESSNESLNESSHDPLVRESYV